MDRIATTEPQSKDHSGAGRVYMAYFDLHEAPFSITPDPHFLYFSSTHRDVLEKLQYGIHSRMGFVLLTGEVGTGKTTLCRSLLDQLQGKASTVYIINPSLSGEELISAILDDLGISYESGSTKKTLIDRLNHHLLNGPRHQPVVIIIDDAQTMPPETFEDLRLLSNLETDKEKMLQILIVGQPELLRALDRSELRQIKQRVALHGNLEHLSREEVAGYIHQRLIVAGSQGQVHFSSKVIARIYKQSNGIPRMINKICDLALTAAYAENSNIINMRHLAAAKEELRLSDYRRPAVKATAQANHALLPIASAALAGILVALSSLIGYAYFFGPFPDIGRVKTYRIPAAEAPQTPERVAEATRNEGVDSLSVELGPYILQLGSYNTFESTIRAVDIFSRKGISAHWNVVDMAEKGLWYRVFTGRYPTRQAARRYQEAMALASAKVLFAPWTLALFDAASLSAPSAISAMLDSHRLDSYRAVGKDGSEYLFSGAYVTRNDAAAMAGQILKQTGFTVRITNSSQPIIPRGSRADKQSEESAS